MKTILSILTACLLLACGLYPIQAQSHAIPCQTTDSPADSIAADSAVDIIAYFAKGDTCDYRITETKWKINDKDTTLTASITTKVRLVVTDSTATGYKMTYTFTDVLNDTIDGSPQNDLLNRIAEKTRKYVIGTSIEFETDEMGAITKVNNLAQIKKKATALFKDGMKDITDLPEMKTLKDMGIDIKDLAKEIDVDELVEGYLEELKMLFLYHGKSFTIGKTHRHEDETEDDLESDTYTTVSVDEDNTSSIDVEVVSILPRADIKEFLVGLVGQLKDKSFADKYGKELDSQFQQFEDNGTISDRYTINCFEDGWPAKVVKQRRVRIGNIERVSQTFIAAYHFSEKK